LKLLLNIVEKALFALPEVMWQQFIGEVGRFAIFWRQVSSRCSRIPKIL